MAQAVLNNINNVMSYKQPEEKASCRTAIDAGAETDFEKLFAGKTEKAEQNNVKIRDTREKTEGYTLGDIKKGILQESSESLPEDADSDILCNEGIFENEMLFDVLPQEETQSAEDAEEAAIEDMPSGLVEVSTEEITEETDGNEDAEETEETEKLENTDTKHQQNSADAVVSEVIQTAQPVISRENQDSETEEETDYSQEKVNTTTGNTKEGPEVIQQEVPADDAVVKTENNPDVKTLEDIIEEEMIDELNIESVETESGNNESDLMQNQTPEEQGVKAMLQLEADYSGVEKTQVQTPSVQTAAKPETASPARILDQISKHLEGLYNSTKVNIVLNPESLGRVSVQLINTNEGLSAQFTVTTQEAKNMLMKGLDGLKETLTAHGVNVDNVTVKMNDAQESEYNPDWTEQEGSRGGNKEQNPHKERQDKEQFEKMMSFVQEENGKV